MKKEPWFEPPPSDEVILAPWKLANNSEAALIAREALRYCPEFPFKPDPQQTFQKQLACYEDYRLVRLAPKESSNYGREVYGFYAPGDFRVVDGFGQTFAWLNKFVPIQLTPQTLLDYALVRLRFELPYILPYSDALSLLGQRSIDRKVAEELIQAFGVDAVHQVVQRLNEPELQDEESVAGKIAQAFSGGYLSDRKDEWRLAKIITPSENLLMDQGKTDRDTTAAFIRNPQIKLKQGEQGETYEVSCSVVLQQSDGGGRVVEVVAPFNLDGTLSWSTVQCKAHDQLLEIDEQAPLAFTPLRANTAVPFQEWYSLDHELEIATADIRRKIGDDNVVWHRALREQYGVGQSVQVRNFILRVADLSFYTTFCLLEVQERLGGSYRRSYALIRRNNERLDIRPLEGTAPVIHEINYEEDKPRIHGDAGGDYLRFFCWAVRGPEGPFLIPRKLREVDLAEPPSREQLKALRELSTPSGEFSITEVAPKGAEGESKRTDSNGKKAYVLYDTALFEAWFNIEPTGAIEMAQDEVRVKELKIRSERYGQDDLFILKSVNARDALVTEDLPVPRHYLEANMEANGQSPPDGPRKKVIEATDFQQQVQTHGELSNAEIGKSVVINDDFFQTEKSDEETS